MPSWMSSRKKAHGKLNVTASVIIDIVIVITTIL